MDATTQVLPTRSLTWVEPSTVTFGWLAATLQPWAAFDHPDPAGALRAAAWDLFAQVRDALPLPSTSNVRSQWYRQGWAADDGSYAVLFDGVGRAAGGVMVTLRQTTFERLGAEGSWLLVRGVSPGLHISRLDLAADGPASVLLPPRDLYALLPAARSRSRRAGQVLTVTQAGDEKLTIGSRASPRYLRCYLKGDRVRHELELKQAVAGSAFAAIAGGSALVLVWAAEYGRLVEWR